MAQSILDGFLALNDAPSRRNVYQGILNALTLNEMREVKSQTDKVTLQRDVLGTLPWDIKCLVAQLLGAGDIFVLRRVSKDWKEMFSSQPMLQAQARVILGKGSTMPTDLHDLEAIIKARRRLELGIAATAARPLDLHEFDHTTAQYSNGNFAMLKRKGSLICELLCLKTGTYRQFTPENREPLICIRLTANFIAVVSVRGYCHIWDIHTEEYKSFRLPSARFLNFIANGTNIAFHYPNKIVYYCFVSGSTREFAIPGHVLTLSLHIDGQMSFIALDNPEGDEGTLSEGNIDDDKWPSYRLLIGRLTAHGKTAQGSTLRYQRLVSLIPREITTVELKTEGSIAHTGGFSRTIHTKYTARGLEVSETVYFLLEADDTLAVHRVSQPRWGDFISYRFSQGLIYSQDHHVRESVVIVCEIVLSSSPGVVQYYLNLRKSKRMLYPEDSEDEYDNQVLNFWGDEDFAIFCYHSSAKPVLVMAFDQRWKCAGNLVPYDSYY